MKERIQKVLANAGIESRRHVEEMVRQGRISVNGRVVTSLPVLVNPETDRITVDDEPVRLRGRGGGGKETRLVYLLMNKPKGVYSTNVAQGEQVLAIDLLPPNFPYRVYPVGRLDHDSKGLLLLTNDGDLTNKLTHPRYEIPKTYQAVIDGHVTADLLGKLSQGIWLATREGKGFKTSPARIKVVHRGTKQSVLEVTLREGRNRQVRRMLAKLGNKVHDLTRVKMGPLTLRGIGPGKFRPLTSDEVKELHRWTAKAEKRASEESPEPMQRRRRRSRSRKPQATPVSAAHDDLDEQ